MTYTTPERGELVQLITPDYPQRIKRARERQGLKQEELAKRLSEKESVIHALESGKHEPDMTLARKLEKQLRITLVEQQELKPAKTTKTKEGALTIGDMLANK